MICLHLEDYIRWCNECLASKIVYYKPYWDLQFLLMPIYCWKDLLIDLVTGLAILIDWNGDNYDSILVFVDWLIKIVFYKPIKVIINSLGLVEVIINVVVRHHGLSDSIVIDWYLLFTSKFWSLLYYFLGIKWRLVTAFYPQMNGQTERQNSTMEAYLWAFINFE